jgi:hypothetical protein
LDLDFSDYTFTFLGLNRRKRFWKSIINYKKEIYFFDTIETISIDNLRLIYLYCLERLKKSINPNNKRLTLIESKFIECSFNKNNKSNEWYNYISERQNYEYIKGNQYNQESDILSQAQIINLFAYSLKLNEKLLTKIQDVEKIIIENFEDSKNKYNNEKQEFFRKVIIKNIIKIAGLIVGKNYEFKENKERYNLLRGFYIFERSIPDYDVQIDDLFLEKLKLMYELDDIILITFYEFIWFEEHYNICEGFLSALKFHVLYNFRMRNHFNQIIQDTKNKERKKIIKKEKKFIKNESFKTKDNNKINNNN